MVALMNRFPNAAFGAFVEKCNARAVVVSCVHFFFFSSFPEGWWQLHPREFRVSCIIFILLHNRLEFEF